MAYLRNDVVRWLLTHSYGQGGTVAVPGPTIPGPLPLGAFPPGIDDLLTWLSSRHLAWTDMAVEVDWCFLVGGPGNGKSEAMRYLATRLGVTLPPRTVGQPVPRTLPLDWPTNAAQILSGLEVAFVNDASIPRADVLADPTCPGSLFADVCDALQRNLTGTATSLFVNVNRGVLVSERAGLSRIPDLASEPPHRRLAAAIVTWLAGQHNVPGLLDIQAPTPTQAHYGQFVVEDTAIDGSSVRICVRVVYLDMLSLLEPKPGNGGPVIDFSQARPIVAPYMTLGKLTSRDVPRDATVAGALLKEYVAPSRWQGGACSDPAGPCAAQGLCPFVQNAHWLQNDNLRNRFLDTLRATEIAANRRLTYRDLLGHVSLALLGAPEVEWLKDKHPCDWVADKHGALTAPTPITTPAATTIQLAQHRIYTNLYPGGGFTISRKIAETRLKGATAFGSIVDLLTATGEPARLLPFEAASSEIDPCKDTDGWDGLRRKVVDMAEASDVIAPMVELATWSTIPAAAISDIDRYLDGVVLGEIASQLPTGSAAAQTRVRILRRWRASMLLRHVGTALCQVRYADAIGAWLAEQESALQDGQRLRLGEGINNLLLPTAAHGRVYVAPLRPRTYCLAGTLPNETLLVAVQMSELDVIIMPNGDTLSATISIRRRGNTSDPVALIVVDLPIAREALLYADGRTTSFTEIGDTAFARIERARASLISRDRLRHINASYTDHDGRIRQLVSSPAGTTPLRIQ